MFTCGSHSSHDGRYQFRLPRSRMVEGTSTPSAPWQLVPANDKRFARVQVLETVCDALKRALKGRKKDR